MPQKLMVSSVGKPRKIKVQISSLVHAQIALDVEDYGLRSASTLFTHLCALGIKTLPATISKEKEDDPMSQEIVSFTLPPAVAAPFVEACMASSIGVAAAVRHLIHTYARRPRCQREELVRSEETKELKKAIQKGYKVRLCYRGIPLTLEPCFLAHSLGMARSYLVSYDSQECDFRCLRLAHIKSVDVLRLEASYRKEPLLSARAKDLRKNFDPFLSFGQNVKVRLTEAGANQMHRATTNRPICDMAKLKAGVHEFRCSPLQAKLYFAAFLDEAEILEPAENLSHC